MTSFVALLRAVNVGGTGKLPMAELAELARGCGFEAVRTYIASGNLLFESAASEAEVKSALEARLADHAGRSVGVMVRSAPEMAGIVDGNPFSDQQGARVAAIFLDEPPPPDAAEQARNLDGERIALGTREIYVFYPEGMGKTRLVLPAAKAGTARNMNTVAKLAELAAREGGEA